MSKLVTFTYRNYAGKVETRLVEPCRIWFGATFWHPKPQWLLEAIDFSKVAKRDFAMNDITDWAETDLPPVDPSVAASAVRVDSGHVSDLNKNL